MTSATIALTVALLAGVPAPPVVPDAPIASGSEGRLLARKRSPFKLRLIRQSEDLPFTVADAPTSPSTSIVASLLTGGAGLLLFAVGGLSEYDSDLNGQTFAFHSRVSSGLLLMSAGPGVGALMNEDVPGFLIGGVGRSLICAGAYALILGSSQETSGRAVLFTTLGAIGWVGWSVADLFRSVFAPRRWVDRHNQAYLESVGPRAPIAEVRQTGGLRYLGN